MTGAAGSALCPRQYSDMLRTASMKASIGVLFVVVCIAPFSGCRTSKQSYVSKGNKLFDGGKFADAALNYRSAIQKDPNYGEAYYRLGRAEIKEQKVKEAFAALVRAHQLLPNSVPVQQELGALSLEIYVISPSRPQRLYDIVKQTSDELLKKNPQSYEGLREKAFLAQTDGKQDEAIAFFRKVLDVKP